MERFFSGGVHRRQNTSRLRCYFLYRSTRCQFRGVSTPHRVGIINIFKSMCNTYKWDTTEHPCNVQDKKECRTSFCKRHTAVKIFELQLSLITRIISTWVVLHLS